MAGRDFPSDSGLDGRPGSVSRRRYGRWVTIGAWVLLVSCLAVSFTIATTWRSMTLNAAHRNFEATAADMGSVVSSTVERNVDFVATLQATVATRPGMNNTEFTRWINSVAALKRYPGTVGYVYVERVPAARLSAFKARLLADRSAVSNGTGRFEVRPQGSRPIYCFVRLIVSPLFMPDVRALGNDYCATEQIPGVMSSVPAQELVAIGRSGTYAAVRLDRLYGLFAMAAPVYRGGGEPTTDAERGQRLLGWVVGTFEPHTLLASSLKTHPGVHVEILHRNTADSRSMWLAHGGPETTHNWIHETTLDSEGTWTIRVAAPKAGAESSANLQFAAVLGAGALISLLIFGFVLVLARSRVRALELVARRTEQLRHQATHDSLTGLPNRAFTVRQVEQALAEARRNGRRGEDTIALMFLDLDEFKMINDTYGHPCGDELLRVVADRLSGALRDDDIVGRLGGDEFIVLLQGASLSEGPETVAGRLGSVLAQPLTLHGRDEQVTVQVRASIGIATGLRADADELLRDADLALYEAKNDGKGHFRVFQAPPVPHHLTDSPSG